MGNNFSSKYELFRNVKADDKKGLNKNYGIFLVLRRKTGISTKTHSQICNICESLVLWTGTCYAT